MSETIHILKTHDRNTRHYLLMLIPVLAFATLLSLLYVKYFKSGNTGESAYQKTEGAKTQASYEPSFTYDTKSIQVGNTTVIAEIADTPEKRTLGLSFRKRLPENGGMLFDFGQIKITPTFWMKDMEIPLDLIWIADGKIVQIDRNVPPPAHGTPDSNLKLYWPSKPIQYVLEVNDGYSEANNLQAEDSVTFD